MVLQRLLSLALLLGSVLACDSCYTPSMNENCRADSEGKGPYTLHMSVHPHLDAYWIFDFESYYDPKPNQGDVRGYFMSNRFNSVKEIFTSAKDVLWESKRIRENVSNQSQQAHRSFFNSEMGFFKRWYVEQNEQAQSQVKTILKTKYWEIMGGGYVEHDEGCAYVDDIIENFELGLHYLKTEFDYYPRAQVAADSFGHSQSTLAILAHLGVEGYFVERSDEHILLQNKTEFIWKAESANGRSYGAMPTHIRWAIHGFEDQFNGGNINEDFCQTKENYMRNLRNENEFLKRILKSNHIMRYFGHDFQRFNNYSYSVIEGMMKKFSMEKCNQVVAVYGNPTEYFITLMKEVFGGNVKPVATRSQDIFPIWDYDSGLYWTGYYTTDAYHKKDYRDLGRLLRATRKAFVTMYSAQPQSDKNKKYYQKLEEVAEQVAYLQHHDGISGTSKYKVMDQLEVLDEKLTNELNEGILRDVFSDEFPLGTANPLFTCHLDRPCKVPPSLKGDVYLKIINTDGSPQRDPIVIEMPVGVFYVPDCPHEFNCFCIEGDCPCKLYLYKPLYAYTAVRLRLADPTAVKVNRLSTMPFNDQFNHNKTHLHIKHDGKDYFIGYKRVTAKPTQRNYAHLSRYGTQQTRGFQIRPGKYALGNDPNTAKDFTQVKGISWLKTERYTFLLVSWKRHMMKTLVSIPSLRPNEWKVETITATEGYHLSDLYFEVITPIKNEKRFVTDSNGWLTMNRELFKHEDYEAHFSPEKFDDLDGNSYPATAFTYIKDSNNKVSVNLERPQGVVAYREGTIWVNFDRLSEDDGKWVYESAYRSEYQKYTHTITVDNHNYNERKIQRRYDQPLLIQGNSISPTTRVEDTEVDYVTRNEWNSIGNIENIKFTVRPFNDSTTVLRVYNMHDEEDVTVGLYAERRSPLLTTYYGRTVGFNKIEETSMGANMNYGQFLNNKWNWKSVVDLGKENHIFNKVMRENITLSPLEIRTFLITDLKFADECIKPSELTFNKMEIRYEVDTSKPAPTREAITLRVEQQVVNYNQKEDHCEGKSPILSTTNVDIGIETRSTGKGNNYYSMKASNSDNPVKADSFVPSEPTFSPHSADTVSTSQNTPTLFTPTQPKPPTREEELKQVLVDHSPPKTTPPPTQSPPSSGPSKTSDVELHSIEEKIQLLQPLSKAQKQAYFSRKLELIRQWKAKSARTG